MSVSVSEVRSETQIPASIITDADIEYLIGKLPSASLDAICAYTLRLVLRKYRGRYRIRIGNIWESIDPKELRSAIRDFESRAGSVVISDDEAVPDSFFTRDGI